MALPLALPHHMRRSRSKLILLIGLECTQEKQVFLQMFNRCHCVFAENGLRGLAAALVLKPDVVICRRDVSLVPASFIRHEILSANSRCKILILGNEKMTQ
ncbi:MAG: hypothetical protein LBB15_01750 [Puniceicoccales bacterium]|jgi:hypothetical protein|nr:hypothetical protein [Puniceicoccales bacterium]